ncbi:MAG: NAD(P)-dependent oxidoreductase [Chloroflexi bacterium]|nr:NAD(P)-dependent oxidoreductase [Chloroflexota bacterium]
MRILITGAAGAVGSTLVKGLRDRYQLRGFDRVPMPDLEDTVVGDLEDVPALMRATQDMEVVMHLAGNPSSAAPWDDILHNNIIGTYNIFEAARQNRVRRIVFASRAGLLAAYPENITRTMDMPPRPDSYYSISKVLGENLGYLYATKYGLEFVAVRIGNFQRDRPYPAHPHHLSHADTVQVFERAAIQPGVKYEIVFGVSDSNWPLYDLNHGRQAIGYEPQDRSEVKIPF